MSRVLRTDLGALRPPKRTPQGFLRVDGYASRTGIFEYADGSGGVRRELRLPEEVFRADVMDAFDGAPVTDDHPPEMVTAENAKKYAIGAVLDPARRDGEMVRTSILVTDATTIGKVEGGKRALSVVYSVDLDETPGTHPQFGRYDAVQRNLAINHLAIVDVGRAGPEAVMRLDSGADVVGLRAGTGAQVRTDTAAPARGEGQMDEIKQKLDAAIADATTQKQRADKLEAELAEMKTRTDSARALADALPKAQAEIAELTKRLDSVDTLEEQVKALKTENEALKKRVDSAEDPARRHAERMARLKIERSASVVLGPEARLDAYEDRALMVAVLDKIGIAFDRNESDAYVRARFDSECERYKATAETLARLGDAPPARKPEIRQDARTAREKYLERQANAWKTQEK